MERVLAQLNTAQYTAPSHYLSGGTIGQHLRHILELYQCLLQGYESGMVNYEKRERNKRIEQDIHFAAGIMQQLLTGINLADKPLTLEVTPGMNTDAVNIHSNFNRELLYNMEHTIHHMALIKVALHELTDIKVPDSFGVAPSTLQYKATCAQ